MKTPITYYGGKTNMARHILPLIPEGYRSYAEPFVGGGAILFAKPKTRVEIINDNFDLAVNFFKVCQEPDHFRELTKMLQSTLHAESEYAKSKAIVKNPDGHPPVVRAWAYYVQCQLTFGHKICAGFAFAKAPLPDTTTRKIVQLTSSICRRLRHVQIFNRDALDIIKKFDAPDTFFYLDPPYANSDCGHYNKGKEVFYRLLEILPGLQAKWLLSSYPCDELEEIWQMPGVYHRKVVQHLAVSGKLNAGRKKTECLTWNYKI